MKSELLSPYEFWCNLDLILSRSQMTLKGFCHLNNIPYRTLTSQRTRQAYPKLETLWQLSAALNISMDCLTTKDEPAANEDRVIAIAKACLHAEEDDLHVIEKILGIQKNNDDTISRIKEAEIREAL